MRMWVLGGLAAGLAIAAGPAGATEHRVRVEHRGGAVDAVYRADVAIDHRQVGAVGPGGRPSTLRCVWSAGVTVEREARHGSGRVMTRAIRRDDVAQGSRHGWCDGQRDAIAKDVAARTDRVRDAMLAAAEEDRSVLRAELDTLHTDQRSG